MARMLLRRLPAACLAVLLSLLPQAVSAQTPPSQAQAYASPNPPRTAKMACTCVERRRLPLGEAERREELSHADGRHVEADARPVRRAGARRHVPHGLDLRVERADDRLRRVARPDHVDRAEGDPGDGAQPTVLNCGRRR